VSGGSFKSSGFGYGQAGKGLSLAFEFAGAVFLFWFLGRLVDNWLNIEPWGQVIGAILGWIGGFLHVYYATQKRG
jgi:F0F1-type ATP synthase assembly protein I